MMQRKGCAGPLLAVLVSAAITSAGCENEIYEIRERQQSEQRASEPEFSWSEALRQPPSAARGWLGPMTGCEPKRQLPALSPEIRGLFPDHSRHCRFPQSDQRPEANYHIDSILYAKQTTTAVMLRPNRSMPLSLKILDEFFLPRLPVIRRRHVDWRGGRRRVISLRMRHIDRDLDRGTPIAVDLIARADDPDRLDAARVAAISEWPYSIDHVELRGPSAVSKQMVLPPSRTGHRLDFSVALQIGLDRVDIAPLERYPLRINGDEIDFLDIEFSRKVLAGDEQLDGTPWQRRAAELTRQWIRRERNLGYDPSPVRVEIFATQTTPYDQLVDAMKGTRSRPDTAFHLGVRRVEAPGASISRFANTRSIPLDLVTPDQTEPAEAGESNEPEFTVRAENDGLDVWAKGRHLSPVDDCPSSGPTLCLTDPVDILERTERARELQRKGDLREAEKQLQRALSAYDWRTLYELATDLRPDVADADRLYVRSESDVPLAVTTRILEVLRHRLAIGAGSDCLEAIPKDASFAEAQPCTIEGSRVPLFDEPTLVESD